MIFRENNLAINDNLKGRITTNKQGTIFPITNPKSITKFVTMIKSACLRPGFVSAVASLAATLPAGYSAPIPTPRQNLQTVNMIIIPWTVGYHAPAHKAEKRMTMIVAATIPTRRPYLSEIYPKRSCPNTSPANTILGTSGVVGSLGYSAGYIFEKIVFTGPATLFK